MKTYPTSPTLLSTTYSPCSSLSSHSDDNDDNYNSPSDSPALLKKDEDLALSRLLALASPLLIAPSSDYNDTSSVSSHSSDTSDTASITSTSSTASSIDADVPATIDSSMESKRKRIVRFLPKVAVRNTISRHTMTNEEIGNCWLQTNEFFMIKQRRKLDDDKWGDRINGMTKTEESYRKRSYRLGASEEVFLEQEEQYLNNLPYDDEAISYVYSQITNECQFLAQQIAIQHREDIEDYIYNDYETI
ncbi:hypothetical protein FRACYDRAFT_245126 [Fragilariopsis cylindrus CCMP1102]|uniref:Uncharacterized protein n=1 Tax=Fragilariopsis cylindrus CCMP1102 TaxID=635003 RepID=A0A1E7F1D8_9STRA|nr:hypothetical protein FRACYDRAFT_245126 [Fragilariopsis cylindrus CCMP1102]|eukprot:OEU12000.1 hypothetical protein FRACYDRAFT_245126 [Fragilariopsis cylindrus CCMP1102]